MAFMLLRWHPSGQVEDGLWVKDAVRISDQDAEATAKAQRRECALDLRSQQQTGRGAERVDLRQEEIQLHPVIDGVSEIQEGKHQRIPVVMLRRLMEK